MKNTTRLYSGLAVAAAVTAMFVATAVPAQAATLSLSGSATCQSQYFLAVKGKALDPKEVVALELPPGTVVKRLASTNVITYQSPTLRTGSWKATAGGTGLDTANTGSYCAPAV